jgi:hypothetical protein
LVWPIPELTPRQQMHMYFLVSLNGGSARLNVSAFTRQHNVGTAEGTLSETGFEPRVAESY